MARVNKNGTNPDMFLGCLFLRETNYESPLLCPCLRTWCCTAGAPTVPCPYTKYLGSGRNKGAENIGLDENRGVGKECRYKTMEQRTGGNSQENVFGWTTKCTDLFF